MQRRRLKGQLESMADQLTTPQLDQLVAGLSAVMTPDRARVKELCADLVNFKPEYVPRPLRGMGISHKEMQSVPFFCETFLYGLLGKDDARSILGRLNRICEAAAGCDMRDLWKED